MYIEKVDIDRYLDSFEPNFTIEKVKSGYKVTFKDSGNEVTMQTRRIRQEATCLCEPTYFTRKKKSWKGTSIKVGVFFLS